MDIETALRRFKGAVGEKGLITDPDVAAPYLAEQRGRYESRAMAIVRPADTGEVAAIMRLCTELRIGVVPQGGNTGLCGGAVATALTILLNLGRMNRIVEVDPLDYTILVEAGCVLQKIQEAAAAADRLFPLSLGAEGSCQIGGNLSTNAGGINVLRYGNARELTLGLEVVLADGTVWRDLNRLRKNNTGYDLRDLFIGAEGTLGVITSAVLRLFPRPRDVQTAMVALDTVDAAVRLLDQARHESGDNLSSFELLSGTAMDFATRHAPGCRNPFGEPRAWYVLMVFADSGGAHRMRGALERCLETAFQTGHIVDAVIAESTSQADALWRIREGVVEAQKSEGASIKHDVSVPVSRVAEFLARADVAIRRAVDGIRPCPFGHLGDGNIHYNLTQPAGADPDEFLAHWDALNRIVHDVVDQLGGSFSAEHGVGTLKTPEMQRYKSAAGLDLMRRIKTALDPVGILNPGKVLPRPDGPAESTGMGRSTP
jgi:D-lactate dehydrogenase (cytochrome)